MKSKSSILTIFLLISSIVSFADFHIVNSTVNARKGPGKKYKVSFTIQKGNKVLLIYKKDKWTKVEYLGKTGYVYSKYLQLEKVDSTREPDKKIEYSSSFFAIFWIITTLYIGFTIYKKLRDKKLLHSVTHKNRGTKSERDLVLQLLKFGFSPQDVFHDLYLEKRNNEFSQIDLVLITNVGIVVFEVKDYSGWIFGTGNQPRWTKSYKTQKYYFYNPIKQNQSHIAALKEKISDLRNLPFFSVIVFYGDCQLKNISYIPDNTLIVKSNRIIDAVKNIVGNNPDFFISNRYEIETILMTTVQNGDVLEIQRRHSENINELLGTNRILD